MSEGRSTVLETHGIGPQNYGFPVDSRCFVQPILGCQATQSQSGIVSHLSMDMDLVKDGEGVTLPKTNMDPGRMAP